MVFFYFLTQEKKVFLLNYEASDNLIILFGETGVGKTSFVRSICEDLHEN